MQSRRRNKNNMIKDMAKIEGAQAAKELILMITIAKIWRGMKMET